MAADFERARDYALGRLARELSPHLTYHSLRHTRDDVWPSAVRLGLDAGIDDESLMCLATAALFHDIGFVTHYHNHEAHGVAIASAALPRFGYSPGQIACVSEMIAATKMPQRPASLLAQLLCDADLDVLGRDDFWDLNRRLLAETRHYQQPDVTEEEWVAGQTRFLAEHRFFSAVARARCDEGKALNLNLMRRALAGLNGSNAST